MTTPAQAEDHSRFYRYWGKADPVHGGWHLAAFHCLDVAAVAEVYLRGHPVLARRLAALLSLPDAEAIPLIALVVALHDFGKFDFRFQAKASEVAQALWPERARIAGGKYDHGAFGYHQLKALLHASPGHRLGTSMLPLLRAVCAHHGAFPSQEATPDFPSQRALRAEDQRARAAWLDAVTAHFEARGAVLPWTGTATLPLMHLLAGFCSVCDWIGSQPESFPYEQREIPLSEYYERALHRASQALKEHPFLPSPASGHSFQELFPGKTPRDVQQTVEAMELPEGPCLVVLEAQMGSGKTEAALSLAERMLARGDATGMYIALPTMATSNGMFERITDAATRLFDGSVQLMLAHGRRDSNDLFRKLVARPLGRGRDEEREASVMCARWFTSRKRALLGQVGVGTIDQALHAVIQVRHQFVRSYGLSTSVVIIDEVHAYDAYMEVLLNRLLAWLGALQTPVILLSATLPSKRREQLIEAYSQGLSSHPPVMPGLAEPAPYPLVTAASRQAVTTHASHSSGISRTFQLERVETANPIDDVLPELTRLAQQGAMVGWIRNTVTEAQQAYHRACESSVPSLLFHSRLRGVDRQRIEREVLSRYGREGARTGCLLIATQVVEQSLDIDFDLLASDLAPIDLILQRAGRLHRHQRARPPGTEVATLKVVSPPESEITKVAFGSSGFVYDPVTLWLAWDSLRDRPALDLPECLRPLVEATYHPEQRAERISNASQRALLQGEELKRLEKLDARQGAAGRVCIPPPWESLVSFKCVSDDDDGVRALTRDGDSQSLVLVQWNGEDATSLEGGPAWKLDPEAPEAWRLARDILEQTISVPAYPWEHIERAFRVRGEAAAWDAWSERFRTFARACGLGELIVIPVRLREGDWVARLATDRRVRPIGYRPDVGLWFREEEKSDA